uniref:Uncharacterized protein n=1 Tax=Globodera pallida TaxID=36090 RepID=A0A183BIP4_GLOPA
MKGRWRPANSEHAETEQVVGRDGGRRKKSDERHWGGERAGDPRSGRARDPQPGHARTSSGARSLATPTGRRSRVCGTLAAIFSDLTV